MDLTKAPPRRPRAELGGVIFLPRSIDKARALLPGGNPGEYALHGFSQRMFDALGITEHAFVEAVAAAANDDDVAAFVTAHTSPEKIATWNAFVAAREPRNGDRVAALENYPWLGERPDLIVTLDILEEDDRRTFAPRGPRLEADDAEMERNGQHAR
jgi:hypothetical protein